MPIGSSWASGSWGDTAWAADTWADDASPPANENPVAGFDHSAIGLTAFFADTSTDIDGTIAEWLWDFGDGAGTSMQQNPSYAYAAADTYTVILEVTDNDGGTDTFQANVTVHDPPPPEDPPTNAVIVRRRGRRRLQFLSILFLFLIGCANSPAPQAAPDTDPPEGYARFYYPKHCRPYPMQVDTLGISGQKVIGPFKAFVFDCEGKIQQQLNGTTPKPFGPSSRTPYEDRRG